MSYDIYIYISKLHAKTSWDWKFTGTPKWYNNTALTLKFCYLTLNSGWGHIRPPLTPIQLDLAQQIAIN